MRRGLSGSALALMLALTLALGGCSGGSSGGTAAGPPSGAAASPDVSPTAAADGAVDCASLSREDLASYLVYTQLIAQVRDQSTVQALRDHSFSDYTPEKFAAILTELQVLAGHPAAGFGDPADSLAYYTKANDLLAAILATSGDVPQAALDEYSAAIGDVGASISKQLPINAAISQYCPST